MFLERGCVDKVLPCAWENGGGGNLMIRVARLDMRGSDIAGTTIMGGERKVKIMRNDLM